MHENSINEKKTKKIKVVVMQTEGDYMKVATEDRRFLTLPMPAGGAFPGEEHWLDREALERDAAASPAARKTAASRDAGQALPWWKRWTGSTDGRRGHMVKGGAVAAAVVFMVLLGWFWHVMAPFAPAPVADPTDSVTPATPAERDAPTVAAPDTDPDTDLEIAADSYLALDINPSLELALDADQQVIALIPYNESGQEVADNVALPETAEEGRDANNSRDPFSVLRAIVREAKALGYVSPDEENMFLVTLVRANEIEADKADEALNQFFDPSILRDELTGHLLELGIRGQIGIQQAEPSDRAKAREEGVSVNNYVLRENAAREAEVPREELEGKNNREVVETLQEKDLPPGQVFQESEGFPPGREQMPDPHPGNNGPPEEHPGEGGPPEDHPGEGASQDEQPDNRASPEERSGDSGPPDAHPGKRESSKDHPGEGEPSDAPSGNGGPPETPPGKEKPKDGPGGAP